MSRDCRRRRIASSEGVCVSMRQEESVGASVELVKRERTAKTRAKVRVG